VARKTLDVSVKPIDSKQILELFAKKHKLASPVNDSCGDPILVAPGYKDRKYPEDSDHLFVWDTSRLGACLMCQSAREWGFAKKRLLKDGDFEGIFSFDTSKRIQTRTAIKETQPRRPRGQFTETFCALRKVNAAKARAAKAQRGREKAGA
jgi:hypothetical protein